MLIDPKLQLWYGKAEVEFNALPFETFVKEVHTAVLPTSWKPNSTTKCCAFARITVLSMISRTITKGHLLIVIWLMVNSKDAYKQSLDSDKRYY